MVTNERSRHHQHHLTGSTAVRPTARSWSHLLHIKLRLDHIYDTAMFQNSTERNCYIDIFNIFSLNRAHRDAYSLDFIYFDLSWICGIGL